MQENARSRAEAEHEISDKALLAKIFGKIRSGCSKAAKCLLAGAKALQPSSATKDAISKLFISIELPQEDVRGALHRPRVHASRPPTKRLKLTAKQVAERVRTLKDGSEPGPSGERPGHVRAAMSAPGGLEAPPRGGHGHSRARPYMGQKKVLRMHKPGQARMEGGNGNTNFFFYTVAAAS